MTLHRSNLAVRPAVALALLALAALSYGCQSSETRGDVGTVGASEAAVDLDTPGVRRTGPNQYDAVIIAFEGGFGPSEVRVPVGAEVRFRVRSADVSHGILIEGTDVALEAPEGAGFSEATHTFTEPGEHPFLCQIYCIGGHDAMTGAVIVE